jgi:hypothetical protein
LKFTSKSLEPSESPKKSIQRKDGAIDPLILNVLTERRNADRNPAETVTRIEAVTVDAEAVTMNLIAVETETENETDEMVVLAILMTLVEVAAMSMVGVF